jgi:hypothetical protein
VLAGHRRLDQLLNNTCAFLLTDLRILIELFFPHGECVAESTVGDEVHLVEDLLLHASVGNTLSQWLKS